MAGGVNTLNYHFHLARFTQDADGVWCAPASCVGLIDLVPPLQDADPDVNYALMACGSMLDSSDSLHYFGSGDLRELTMRGVDSSAWGSITAYTPQGGTLAEALRDHLTYGSQASGAEFTRPLTCGTGRQLEINLAGEQIWNYTLSGMGDALSQTVIETEWETLRDIYRAVLAGRLPVEVYRKCLGGLGIKYALAGPADAYLPIADPLLPRLDPIRPQTTVTETWPTNGAITSGQDNSWTTLSGSVIQASGGSITGDTSVAHARMGYAFGSSDNDCTAVVVDKGTTSFSGPGCRADSSADTFYHTRMNSTTIRSRKCIAGTVTVLGSLANESWVDGDTVASTALGSTIKSLRNASASITVTDTSIASGLYAAVELISATIRLGTITATDNLSSGAVIPVFMNQYRQRWA